MPRIRELREESADSVQEGVDVLWEVTNHVNNVEQNVRKNYSINFTKERRRIYSYCKKLSEMNGSVMDVVVVLSEKFTGDYSLEVKQLCADCIIDVKNLVKNTLNIGENLYQDEDKKHVEHNVHTLEKSSDRLILLLKLCIIKILMRDIMPKSNLFVELESIEYGEEENVFEFLFKILTRDDRMAGLKLCNFELENVYLIYLKKKSDGQRQVVIFDSKQIVCETNESELSYLKNGDVFYLCLKGLCEILF